MLRATLLALLLAASCLSAYAATPDQLTTPTLVSVEERIVDELNLARTHPETYAAALAEIRKNSTDGRVRIPGESSWRAKERLAVLDEAIRFLNHAAPLPPLALSKGLSRAARDHANDQAATGAMGHRGRDGSTPWARASRYGSWQSRMGENVAYFFKTPRGIVLALIIDDGVRGRGHRAAIFSADFRVVGVAFGPHPKKRYMCVMDFAAGFAEKE